MNDRGLRLRLLKARLRKPREPFYVSGLAADGTAVETVYVRDRVTAMLWVRTYQRGGLRPRIVADAVRGVS